MSEARDRRRERHDASTDKASPVDLLKKFRVPIVILLLLGAFITFQVTTAGGCPGHWHNTTDVVLDEGSGPQVLDTTAGGYYTLENGILPISTHMHQGAPNVYHYEPTPSECVDHSLALDRADIDLNANSIVLSGQHAKAGTYTANDTMVVQYYYKEFGGSWDVSSAKSVNNGQIADGTQVIAYYGPAADMADITALATPYPSNLAPSTASDFPVVPIIAGSVIALVGIWVWRVFTSGGLKK